MCASKAFLCVAGEVGPRSDYCDAADWMESQEILVAGHDNVRASIDGCREELVVLRITGRADWLQDVDDFDERRHAFEECVAPLPTHERIELR